MPKRLSDMPVKSLSQIECRREFEKYAREIKLNLNDIASWGPAWSLFVRGYNTGTKYAQKVLAKIITNSF